MVGEGYLGFCEHGLCDLQDLHERRTALRYDELVWVASTESEPTGMHKARHEWI